VEHQDALEPPVIDALGNVDALDYIGTVLIDDLPSVAHEVVVRPRGLSLVPRHAGTLARAQARILFVCR
jgi:hypothetical protein